MRVGPIGPSPVSLRRFPPPDASAFRSKPAQKVPCPPVSTATDRTSSFSKRRKLPARAAAVSESTAFRTVGRSMMTVSTAPSTSSLSVLERASLVIVFHERIAVIGGRRVRLLDHPRTHPPDQVEERARLVVGARRTSASERLHPDDRAGRLVVDVEVAGGVDEPFRGFPDRLPVAGEDRAGQPVRACAVAEVERLVELAVSVAIDGQVRTKELLPQQLEVRLGRLDDRRPDEPSDLVVALAAGDDL